MEMEHINDHTILIKIANQDLQDRGLSLTDLFSSPGQIESFFHEIIEEMQLEDQFTDTEALTFQVMPSMDGLEVYVIKNKSQGSDENSSSHDDPVLQKVLDMIHQTMNRGKRKKSVVKESKNETPPVEPESIKLDQTIVFADIEDFFMLANNYPLENEQTTLYQYHQNYFLHIVGEETDENEYENRLAILLEYGARSAVSVEVLSEYGQQVMSKDAIKVAKTFFSK